MKDSERSGGRPGPSTRDRNPQRVLSAFWAQLASIYVLAGLLAVALIGAFALAAGLVVLHRGSVNLVERQLDMLASAAGASVAWALETMPLDSRGDLSEANAARLAAQLSRRLPGATAMITRRTDTGVTASTSSPSNAPVAWPQWLNEAGFRGVVRAGGRLYVRATAVSGDSQRSIRVLFSIPLDEGLARLISDATGLSVKLGSDRGRIPSDRSRPEALLRTLNGLIESGGGPGEGGWMPVVAVAREWRTGNLEEHRALAVKPDLLTMSRQLAQFGRGQAAWVFVLSGLSAGFLLMQTAGVAFAVRMGRRIVLSINDLTAGAARVGSGDLAHRVPVRHRDQIGRLAESFNSMTASLAELQEKARGKELLEHELRLARDVQSALYPETPLELPGATVAGSWRAARTVSGDLYDFLEIAPGRLGVLCADVSGKGMPAAMLMANLQAHIQGLTGSARTGSGNGSRFWLSPAEVLTEVNRELCRRTHDCRFVTIFWAEYDPIQRILRYANAGHNAPLYLKPGESDPVRLPASGPPVGLFADAFYDDETILLAPGSALIAFTDGLTEAYATSGEEFGEARLIDVCRMSSGLRADRLIDAVWTAHEEWTAGVDRADDATIVVLKVHEPQQAVPRTACLLDRGATKEAALQQVEV